MCPEIIQILTSLTFIFCRSISPDSNTNTCRTEVSKKEAHPAIACITCHRYGLSLLKRLSGAKSHPRVVLPLLAAKREITSSDLHGYSELLNMSFITFVLSREQGKETLTSLLKKNIFFLTLYRSDLLDFLSAHSTLIHPLSS